MQSLPYVSGECLLQDFLPGKPIILLNELYLPEDLNEHAVFFMLVMITLQKTIFWVSL